MFKKIKSWIRKIFAMDNYNKSNPHNKMVSKYSLDGILLESYESVSAAAERNGLSKASISNAANGKQYKAGGYIWKFYTGELVIDASFAIKNKTRDGKDK